MLAKFASNSFLLLLQYGASAFVPLLLVPHIIGEIGLAAFGTLAIGLSLASYGVLVIQYTFHLTGPRQLASAGDESTKARIFCQILSAKLTLSIAVLTAFSLGGLLSSGLGHPLTASQAWLIVSISLASVFHTGWHLHGTGRFGIYSILSIIGVALALVVGLARVTTNGSAVLAAAAVALSIGPIWVGGATFIASISTVAHAFRSSTSVLACFTPWHQLREGWLLFASQLTAALYGGSGPLVVAWLIGAEQAGAYSVVERAANAVLSACLLTHTAAYPRLAQLYVADRRSYLRMMRIAIGAYLSIAAIIVFGAVVKWQELLNYLLGAHANEYSTLLAFGFAWIVLGIFGTALTGYLTIRNQPRLVLRLTARIFFASIIIGIPAVVVFGSWGWIAALCVAQLLNVTAGFRAWAAELKGLAAADSGNVVSHFACQPSDASRTEMPVRLI